MLRFNIEMIKPQHSSLSLNHNTVRGNLSRSSFCLEHIQLKIVDVASAAVASSYCPTPSGAALS